MRPSTARFAFIAPVATAIAALAAVLAGARCYPEDTRAVVFIQGIYTTLDEAGTQSTGVEDHRFDTLKAAFRERGYEDGDLLDFSYAGGTVRSDGSWAPQPYDCEETDRRLADSVARLEAMLRDWRDEHGDDAHFALVGHSLGGMVAFQAAARDAARSEDERLGIDVAVTLDAPLKGISADKKAIIDVINCDKTYLAGADLVAARFDPATPDIRRYQAYVMAQAGIRLATFGNLNDCLFRTARCIGGDWADDGDTQFLDGQAAVSQAYEVVSHPLYSHDAILAHPPAVADIIAFVGAP